MTKEEKITLIKEEFSTIHLIRVVRICCLQYLKKKVLKATLTMCFITDNDWKLSTYIGIRIDSSYQQMLNIKDLENSEYL